MKSSRTLPIYNVSGSKIIKSIDHLATEEPLEIRIRYGSLDNRMNKTISVTMRTPGNDLELAKGFLYTEGIVKGVEDITGSRDSNNENVIIVELDKDLTLDLKKLERNFYTTSSCGVCGKSSIEAIRSARRITPEFNDITIPLELLYSLPEKLRTQQELFQSTGGLHACALFNVQGTLLLIREDVGRHNALDKIIGTALDKPVLPLGNTILLLSGRASFELIQKAWMAGINIVAAIGAPSSLAVELAFESGITLVGFLRDGKFNIYSGAERILDR